MLEYRIRRRWGGWQVHGKYSYSYYWYWLASFASEWEAEAYVKRCKETSS